MNIFDKRLSRKMGEFTLNLFIKNFTNECYLNGQGVKIEWKELKKSTLALKAKRGRENYPILFDSGKLKKSFHLNLTKDGFTITNNAEYAIFLQEGTENMPARPIMYEDSTINKQCIEFIDIEVQKLLKNILKK